MVLHFVFGHICVVIKDSHHVGFACAYRLPQLIAELQTSACDSKEEAVRLQQAMEKRLRETSDRWDEERRRMSADADQAVKVSVRRNRLALQRQMSPPG